MERRLNTFLALVAGCGNRRGECYHAIPDLVFLTQSETVGSFKNRERRAEVSVDVSEHAPPLLYTDEDF